MATNGPISKLVAGRPGQALGGRRGPLVVAAVSACLAAVLIYMFVSRQHSSTAPVAVAPTQSTVFVATRYIPAGTPFSVISSENLLKRETVSSTQAIPSAIYDPSQVSSQTTTESIAAGQQVTTVEFRPAATVAIPAYLQGTYRGVAFSMNSYQGLTAGLKAGEFVDVMLVKRNGQSELLASNIEVLSNLAGNVILRLTDKQALLLTAGTTIGTLWLDYRPAHGAKQEIKVGDQEAL